MPASAPTGWNAESGLAAGSRKYTHPKYPDWSIYTASDGGHVTVYWMGMTEPGNYSSVEVAAAHVAAEAAKHA